MCRITSAWDPHRAQTMTIHIPLPTLADWRSVGFVVRGMVVARPDTVAA